jgi:hypothetical protein
MLLVLVSCWINCVSWFKDAFQKLLVAVISMSLLDELCKAKKLGQRNRYSVWLWAG